VSTTPEERLVTLEVLLREVLRRLDSEVAPRATDQEIRLRGIESTVTELKVRSALVAGGVGTGAGILTALVTHLIGG
jgi:hypothetical protein